MSKEQVYDDEIAPLMARIIEVSKRAGIACFCTFDISAEDDPGFHCTTCLPDGDGVFPDAIRDCERRVCRRPQFMAFAITTEGGEKGGG